MVGRVVARDTRNDLALIAVDSPLASVASFRRTPIRAGEDVIALGFPLPGLLATDLNVSKGIVSATAGLRNDTSELQISTPHRGAGDPSQIRRRIEVIASRQGIHQARNFPKVPLKNRQLAAGPFTLRVESRTNHRVETI
jgi:hypothetical protein